jgi:hypothetical protein
MITSAGVRERASFVVAAAAIVSAVVEDLFQLMAASRDVPRCC